MNHYSFVPRAWLHLRNAWLGLRENGWLRTWDRTCDLVRRHLPWRPQHRIALADKKLVRMLSEVPCSADPLASIIIPVFNNIDYTLACLAAVVSCNDTSSYELVVVDDASTDATATRVSCIQGVRYVRNRCNEGFIGSCNRGAAIARGKFLVFLNNDTAVQPGWLDALLTTFEIHPDAGLVGSKLLYPNGLLQEAGGILYADGRGGNYGRFDAALDPRYTHVREVDYCSGAAIAMCKKLFMKLGGFDDRYRPAYYEDADLAMRVRESGYKVLYQPQSLVVHFEGITSGTSEAGGVKAYQGRNRELFLQRWRDRLSHDHPSWGTPLDQAALGPSRRELLIFKHAIAAMGAVRLLEELVLSRRIPILWIEEGTLPDSWRHKWEAQGIEIWSGYWKMSFGGWMRRHHVRLGNIWLVPPADRERYRRAIEQWKGAASLRVWGHETQ